MKKALRLLNPLIWVAVFAVQSCKENIEPTPVTEKATNDVIHIGGVNVKLQSDRLTFTDNEQLKVVVSNLLKLSTDKLIATTSEDNFTSYAEYVTALAQRAKNQEDSPEQQMRDGKLPLIVSPIVKLLVNRDGVVQVGNEVYTVKSENVYQIDAATYDKNRTQPIETIEGVQITAIKASLGKHSNARVRFPIQTAFFDDSHAMDAFVETNTYAFYSEVRLVTQFREKRRQGFWPVYWYDWVDAGNCQFTRLTIESATVYEWVNGTEAWFPKGFQQVQTQGTASIFLDWVAGAAYIDLPSLHSLHEARYNNVTLSRRFDW